MRLYLIAPFTLFIFGCSPMKSDPQIPPYRVFLKGDIDSLSTCKAEHTDCTNPDEFCVAAPYYLGSQRHCLSRNQIGELFGCSTGDLIIMPAEPYQLDCI